MRGVFDREGTNGLIFRDFDNALKNPFRYVHLFLLHTLLSEKNSENRHAIPVTEGPKLRCLICGVWGYFQNFSLIIMCVIGKDAYI